VLDDLQPGDPRQMGRYRLIKRLGSGGMGRVFLGRSPGGHLVAVKVISAELADDRDFRVRFGRELAAARKVSCLFTAPVVDADVDAPQPWLATAYVKGPSLGEAVAADGPMSAGPVQELTAGLAEGLAGIHAAGVIHRDLKPSNVLLADDGPRIIDFGVSRAAEASSLTRSGLVVGSPGYMSPEQAEGRAVGPASDIFSLGAVLVFAASGDGPFGTGTIPALLYRIVHGEPDLDRLPPKLRSLAARCLAKDPSARPGTAEILALVCQGHLTGPRSGHSAVAQLARRPAGLTAVARPGPGPAAPTTGAAPVLPPAANTITRTAPALAAASPLAAAAPSPGQATDGLPAKNPRRGRRALILGGAAVLVVAAVATAVGAFLPAAGSSRIHYVRAATLEVPGFGVGAVAFSPGGRTIATAAQFAKIFLWSLSTDTRIATLTDPASKGVNSVAFSPGGRTLAVGDNNGRTYLWSLATDTRIATLTDPASLGAWSVAFSPGGRTLAVGDENGRTYLWSLATDTRIATLTDPASKGAWSVAFSPGGRTLAVGDDNGRTYLWSLATDTRIATLTDPNSEGVDSVAFGDGGRILATGDYNGRTYLWSLATDTRIATLADPASKGVNSVAFSPGDRILATGDGNDRTYLWSLATDTRIATLAIPVAEGSPESTEGVIAVAFSPSGILATGGFLSGTYLWRNVG
jgi:hypothetical protein